MAYSNNLLASRRPQEQLIGGEMSGNLEAIG
jgi:hypothetical protein